MKTLDEMIAVMEASKTKEIEVRAVTWPEVDWIIEHARPLIFDWVHYDYRVKPEMKEPARVILYLVGDFWHSDIYDVAQHCPPYPSSEFIELTPEVKEKLGIA